MVLQPGQVESLDYLVASGLFGEDRGTVAQRLLLERLRQPEVAHFWRPVAERQRTRRERGR
jgi:hypothetical protein